MDELYKQYGQLMVQSELLQQQIDRVKRQINSELIELNKPKSPKVENGE